MFSELHKATTAMVRELLFPAPALILLLQPLVLLLMFDLLRADVKWRGRRCNRKGVRVPAEFIFSK